MLHDFIVEFENNTSSYDNFRKYEDVLVKYRIIEPNIFRIQNLISLNPNDFLLFGRMLCKLADKHNVVITGKAQPNFVGPSITKNNTFFIGLNQDRLLKLYQKFGFEVTEETTGYQVKRSPKCILQ